MKVTIVIRTYNRPYFLKEALASIHFQTYKNWEVIIFDDAANTENFEIYNNFKLSHPTNTVLYVTSATPYHLFKNSWHLGLKMASGEIMVRLDDDDLLIEDTLEFLCKTYKTHSTLDFSYGSCVYFSNNELEKLNETKTPYELPKTKDIWAGYLKGYPYNKPWEFKKNHYKTEREYTSIIHASKSNLMCVYHTYVIRVKSALKVIDKFEITSNFVDDLEMLASLEYLGLSHTSIKRVLTYVRNHPLGRITDKKNKVEGKNLWEDILSVRDKVEYLRPPKFKTNIYINNIDGNLNEGKISKAHHRYFKKYREKILKLNDKFESPKKEIDWRKFL